MRIFMSADTVGGVWHYALELAAELIQAGDTVAIAAMGGRLSRAQRAAVAAIPGLIVHDSGYRLEWMEAPWDDLERAGAWLRLLAAEFRPDIVHLNHYAHGELQWPAPVLRVAHSCVYSWYHAVLGRAPEPRWQRYRSLARQGLQAADMVAAPSLAMLAQAERFYGPFRHARVIHNGRKPQLFTAGPKQPLILSAGRIWDEAKNIAALARVAPRLPWPVAVAGEARHPDGGKAELPGLQVLGSLPPAQLRKALAGAGIYCLPARYEPFGLSVLEAALSGCALVLGDIDSLRELWDGAALFVEPGDEDGLSDALTRLAQDETLRQAHAQRAQHRGQRYTTARMVADYRTLYQQLKNAARPPRRALGA
jgi:glycogen(starch) synthase